MPASDRVEDVPPPLLARSAWASVQGYRVASAGGSYRGSAVAGWTECRLAEEVAVSLLYGGIPHAVMMATPADLEDFAVGFSITEGLAEREGDIRAIEVWPDADGIAVDVTLAPHLLHAFMSRRRVRNLRGSTSCGLCGVEDLAGVRQPAKRTRPGRPVSPEAIVLALARLRAEQPLSGETRAAHAAAFADVAGELLLVREDVGRHNALDKLIGAALRTDVDLATGFCVVTSRCSFEMVQKAVAARIPILVAISAPTALAVRTAAEAGLTVVALARDDGQTVYCGPERIVTPRGELRVELVA